MSVFRQSLEIVKEELLIDAAFLNAGGSANLSFQVADRLHQILYAFLYSLTTLTNILGNPGIFLVRNELLIFREGSELCRLLSIVFHNIGEKDRVGASVRNMIVAAQL